MNNKKYILIGEQMYYKLTFYFWDFEWEDSATFFFKTREDAELAQKEIEDTNTNRNRSFSIDECTFDQMKAEISVAAYEKLFGITIEEPCVRAIRKVRPYCHSDCGFLVQCQEEYDDEPIGYCAYSDRKYIASMNEIRSGGCECVTEER